MTDDRGSRRSDERDPLREELAGALDLAYDHPEVAARYAGFLLKQKAMADAAKDAADASDPADTPPPPVDPYAGLSIPERLEAQRLELLGEEMTKGGLTDEDWYVGFKRTESASIGGHHWEKVSEWRPIGTSGISISTSKFTHPDGTAWVTTTTRDSTTGIKTIHREDLAADGTVTGTTTHELPWVKQGDPNGSYGNPADIIAKLDENGMFGTDVIRDAVTGAGFPGSSGPDVGEVGGDGRSGEAPSWDSTGMGSSEGDPFAGFGFLYDQPSDGSVDDGAEAGVADPGVGGDIGGGIGGTPSDPGSHGAPSGAPGDAGDAGAPVGAGAPSGGGGAPPSGGGGGEPGDGSQYLEALEITVGGPDRGGSVFKGNADGSVEVWFDDGTYEKFDSEQDYFDDRPSTTGTWSAADNPPPAVEYEAEEHPASDDDGGGDDEDEATTASADDAAASDDDTAMPLPDAIGGHAPDPAVALGEALDEIWSDRTPSRDGDDLSGAVPLTGGDGLGDPSPVAEPVVLSDAGLFGGATPRFLDPPPQPTVDDIVGPGDDGLTVDGPDVGDAGPALDGFGL